MSLQWSKPHKRPKDGTDCGYVSRVKDGHWFCRKCGASGYVEPAQ